MATIKFIRGTTEENSTYTGEANSVSVDTGKKSIRVHDGVTPGGSLLATAADVDVATGELRTDLEASTGADMIGYGATDVASALAALEAGGGGAGPAPYPASAIEALTAGDFVNVFSSGGSIMVRKADGGPNKFPAHGFVLASAGSGTTAQVSPLTSVNDALSGLIPGTEYYLSTSTAGGVQTTPPNSTNVLRQSLGVAISATTIVTTTAMAVELV